MAVDCMQKAKSSAGFNNGSTVVGCDKQGNKYVINPKVNTVRDDTTTYNLLKDRFKDYTYYTA